VYGRVCRRMAVIATHVKAPMQSHGLGGLGGLLSHVALGRSDSLVVFIGPVNTTTYTLFGVYNH
jgi:hypothetical protein